MGDLVVVAPVVPSREAELRAHLLALDPSPLAELPYDTHFARFVILPLDGPRLFFSSRFDAKVPRYLGALAMLPGAAEIWSHCVGGASGDLRGYLERHRLKSPYILPAWKKATVREVNEALEHQERLSRLVVEAPKLGAVGLAHAFRERFPR